MRRDPFLDFHRTAESAGYPALLVMSMFALALVVTPVLLLAVTRAVWTLVLALLGIVAALALLAGELRAAFADADEAGPPPDAAAHGEPERVRPAPELRDRRDRRAA